MSEKAYTPRAEYRCSESLGATHYMGCACHEEGWARRLDMERKEILQLRSENTKLRDALIMVLSSALMETDGHDWITCEQPSCMAARGALAAVFPTFHVEQKVDGENSPKKEKCAK